MALGAKIRQGGSVLNAVFVLACEEFMVGREDICAAKERCLIEVTSCLS